MSRPTPIQGDTVRFDISLSVDVKDYQELEEQLSSLDAVGGQIKEIRCQQWGLMPIPQKYDPPKETRG